MGGLKFGHVSILGKPTEVMILTVSWRRDGTGCRLVLIIYQCHWFYLKDTNERLFDLVGVPF